MKKLIYFFLLAIVFLGAFFRLYDISKNPPGLYIDEISIGLNAYDILKTGKDQYGIPHPLAFAAFGEYKMPAYIYLVSGSMAIFGKNEFAVRFPSALFGTLTLVLLFFLSRVLLLGNTTTRKYADMLSLGAAFILAISSWHIHFSRAGFEATVALFFYTLSLLLFLYFRQTKKFWLIFISSISLLLTFYTYDGYRLLVPLTVIVGLIASFRNQKTRISAILATGLFILLALPLIIFTLQGGGLIRLQQTSAFFPPIYANPLQNFLTNIVIFIKNYLSYYSITFLFRYGDQFNRHQIQDFGLLYLWQLPYVVSGLFVLTKMQKKSLWVLMLFLLLALPIAPALTKPSPHTLRFLAAVVPLTLLTVLGFYQLLMQKGKWVKTVLVVTVVFAVVEFGYYLHYYYVHYPKDALRDWGGSCKQVAAAVQNEAAKGNTVIIDESVPCVTEYFLFYAPTVKPIYTPVNILPSTTGKRILVTSPTDANKGRTPGKKLYDILLPNLNHDIFAQVWQL